MGAILAHQCNPVIFSNEHQQIRDFEAVKESAVFTLFGQLQSSISDLMWIKTLEYLHNGIIYRMPTEHEREQGIRAISFCKMGGGVCHHDGPSLIPGKDRDWRGILGEIDRNIEPWRPGKPLHSGPQQLIPWYRLLVKFNPHYITAYTNGAFFMTDFAQMPKMGVDFLLEGARNNPWSFEIQAKLGEIYFDSFQDYEKAAQALEKAAKLGMKEKKWLADHKEEMDPTQKRLYRETFLYLARSYDKLGKLDKALAACETGIREIPDYPLLRVERRIVKKHKKGIYNTPKQDNTAAGRQKKTASADRSENSS